MVAKMQKWTDVKGSCGHTFKMLIAGFRASDREAHARSLDGTRLCKDCYKAQQKSEAEEELPYRLSEASNRAAKDGLPPLVGTPKQVVWASDIREQMIGKAAVAIDELTDDSETALREELVARFRRSNNAGWWIDHRKDDPAKAIKSTIEEYRARAKLGLIGSDMSDAIVEHELRVSA